MQVLTDLWKIPLSQYLISIVFKKISKIHKGDTCYKDTMIFKFYYLILALF
jgi:hypothetical protein